MMLEVQLQLHGTIQIDARLEDWKAHSVEQDIKEYMRIN